MRDVIIVGGGHNALVAAFYLAKAGKSPLILERRATIGGCATSEEFAPRHRAEPPAPTPGPNRASIARDILLERLGVGHLHLDPRLIPAGREGRPPGFSADA